MNLDFYINVNGAGEELINGNYIPHGVDEYVHQNGKFKISGVALQYTNVKMWGIIEIQDNLKYNRTIRPLYALNTVDLFSNQDWKCIFGSSPEPSIKKINLAPNLNQKAIESMDIDEISSSMQELELNDNKKSSSDNSSSIPPLFRRTFQSQSVSQKKKTKQIKRSKWDDADTDDDVHIQPKKKQRLYNGQSKQSK